MRAVYGFGEDKMYMPDPKDTAHTPLLGPDVNYVQLVDQFLKSLYFWMKWLWTEGMEEIIRQQFFLDFPHLIQWQNMWDKIANLTIAFLGEPQL